MPDHDTQLIEALNGIQAELRRLNQTLSSMGGTSTRAPQSYSSSAAPSRGRISGSSSAPSRGRSAAGSRSSSYSRPERSEEGAGFDTDKPRFPKKKSATSRTSTSRPKGKPPAKKGDGYPKRAR